MTQLEANELMLEAWKRAEDAQLQLDYWKEVHDLTNFDLQQYLWEHSKEGIEFGEQLTEMGKLYTEEATVASSEIATTTVAEGTAAEAFSTYASSAGATLAESGGASTALATTETYSVAVGETVAAEGAASTGIATAVLPIAAEVGVCALAAGAGWYMGTKIREENPEFWDRIMFKIGDYVTGNNLTACLDSNGQIYLPSEIQSIVAQLCEESVGIRDTVSEGQYTFANISTTPLTSYTSFIDENLTKLDNINKICGWGYNGPYHHTKIGEYLALVETYRKGRPALINLSGDGTGVSIQIIAEDSKSKITLNKASDYTSYPEGVEYDITRFDKPNQSNAENFSFIQFDFNCYDDSYGDTPYESSHGGPINAPNYVRCIYEHVTKWWPKRGDNYVDCDIYLYFPNFGLEIGGEAGVTKKDISSYKKPNDINIFKGTKETTDEDGNKKSENIMVPYTPISLQSYVDNENGVDSSPYEGTSQDDITKLFRDDIVQREEKEQEKDNGKDDSPQISNDPEVSPETKPEGQTYTPTSDPVKPQDPSGQSDDPKIPTTVPIGSSASGLLHVYNPTQSQIDSFGSWLWTTWSSDILDTLAKMFNSPMEGIVGLHELYTTPITGGSANIKCGYLDSGISSKTVTQRYSSINCGNVIIPEVMGNYLDYSPYTKVFAYLPFIGIVELQADDIIGNAVNITYNIDAYNGSCIAVITVARTNYSNSIYQFSGNCAVQVPYSSGVRSAEQSALLGLASVGIAAATGGIAGGVTAGASAGSMAARSAASAVSYNANNVLGSKNTVQHSGSFGSSFGAMGAKVPYLIVKRPREVKVNNYNDQYGYPAHKMVRIGSCSGFLRAREANVISVTATEKEKEMIQNLLTIGVYVS